MIITEESKPSLEPVSAPAQHSGSTSPSPDWETLRRSTTVLPNLAYYAPPPAYDYVEHQNVQLANQCTPLLQADATLLTASAHVQKCRSSRWRAFAALILAYVLTITLTQVFRYNHQHSWGEAEMPDESQGVIDAEDNCIPDQVYTHSPRNWDDTDWERPGTQYHDPPNVIPPTISNWRYKIPASQLESFFVLSRGEHSHGRLQYKEAQRGVDSMENIVIDVDTMYWNPSVANSVKMCKLLKASRPNEKGFAVLTPKGNWSWMPEEQRSVRFDIVITIPVGRHPRLRELTSVMPSFEHHVSGFKNHVWSNVELITTESPILVKDVLNAVSLSLETTNGAVQGRFYSSRTISLRTTNGPIDAITELAYDITNEANVMASTASMDSTNGRLNASFSFATRAKPFLSYPPPSQSRGSQESYPLRRDGESLLTQRPTSVGGQYSVNLSTSNAPLLILVSNAPLNSTIAINGSTTNGVARTSLTRSIEGSFDLRTTNGALKAVTKLGKADDPVLERNGSRERARQPILNTNHQSRTHLGGSFQWGRGTREDLPFSNIVVKTTNAGNSMIWG